VSSLVLFIDFPIESRIRCLSYGKKEESARSGARQIGGIERREKARCEPIARATAGDSAKGDFGSVGEEEEAKRATAIARILRFSTRNACTAPVSGHVDGE
jgi:hypothetical protein